MTRRIQQTFAARSLLVEILNYGRINLKNCCVLVVGRLMSKVARFVMAVACESLQTTGGFRSLACRITGGVQGPCCSRNRSSSFTIGVLSALVCRTQLSSRRFGVYVTSMIVKKSTFIALSCLTGLDLDDLFHGILASPGVRLGNGSPGPGRAIVDQRLLSARYPFIRCHSFALSWHRRNWRVPEFLTKP